MSTVQVKGTLHSSEVEFKKECPHTTISNTSISSTDANESQLKFDRQIAADTGGGETKIQSDNFTNAGVGRPCNGEHVVSNSKSGDSRRKLDSVMVNMTMPTKESTSAEYLSNGVADDISSASEKGFVYGQKSIRSTMEDIKVTQSDHRDSKSDRFANHQIELSSSDHSPESSRGQSTVKCYKDSGENLSSVSDKPGHCNSTFSKPKVDTVLEVRNGGNSRDRFESNDKEDATLRLQNSSSQPMPRCETNIPPPSLKIANGNNSYKVEKRTEKLDNCQHYVTTENGAKDPSVNLSKSCVSYTDDTSSDSSDFTERTPSATSSDIKLVNKKTYVMSKLPIKSSSTIGVKGVNVERSGQGIETPSNSSSKRSEFEIRSKDDSYLDDTCDTEAQEFERCLSAIEGGEKRRSRGLWSQSWNPEAIIHQGLKPDITMVSSAINSQGSNLLGNPESGSSHSRVESSQLSNDSSEQGKFGKDENANYCFPINSNIGILKQDNTQTPSSLMPRKIDNAPNSSESRSMVPRPVRSTTASSMEEMCQRKSFLNNETDSPKSTRASKLNASDSCIPINISGRSRSLVSKRERPLSASTLIGNKKSPDTGDASILSRSLQNDRHFPEGELSELMSVRSLSSSSCDTESHESGYIISERVTDRLDTAAQNECFNETPNIPYSKSSTAFGPLSSTPIKLPGASRETLRQRQVMEVSPSFDHLSVDPSFSVRPSTLNTNDLDSASEDGCYTDGSTTDRWNRENVQTLKTRHSRQIHDLQAYYETELRRLQEEISDLHRRVVSRPSSSPMIRLKYLEQIREELDQRCQQFERRNNQLQEDCERWSQRCFEMERRCRTSECERQTVYERCSRLEHEKRKVEVELLKTQEMLNESFRERRQLEEHLLSLKKKEFSWNGVIKPEGQAVNDLQNELQSTRDLCSDKDHTIKRLEQQRDELRRNLDNTIHQVDELKQTMCVSPKDRDLFQKLLEEYEALYRQHQKMRAMYKDAIDKMESNAVEVDVLKGLLSKLENDCSKLRESKELLSSSGDGKSKIPVRADGNQIKRKDSARRDLFKPTLNIFQTPSSSSVDLTASDSESVQSDKPCDKKNLRRYKTISSSEKSKDGRTDLRNQAVVTKFTDHSKSKTTQGDSCFAGSIWEAAERDHSRSASLSEKMTKESKYNESQSSLSWNVPFSEESSRLKKTKEDMLKTHTQKERKYSDSTCSDSSKQTSPAVSRKEQNWVIETRDGVTRFDVVFDGPNRNKPSKPREIVRPEKEVDAYGPPKKYQSTKDSYTASSVDDSDNSFMTKFSSADCSSPRMQTKKDYKAGRTSTLLAGERDTKAYEERKHKVSDLEQEFKKLTQERESIESQLRKIPTGRTTRKKLDEKEALEQRLDQVLKRIGTVKMSLRRFDAL